MLIDFYQAQRQQFMSVARQIEAQPERYLQLDSVADFYQASWLGEFPAGTIWYVSGLDDGADEFEVLIEYRELQLKLSCGAQRSARIVRKH